MLHAFTKTRFEDSVKERFEKDQSGIVMVIMARYSIDMVKQMIKENYDFWHINAGRVVDIYLAGYGAFLPADNKNKDYTVVEGTNLFFNNRAFKTFKDALYKDMGLEYDDRIEIFLIDYYDNKIHYKGALRIDVSASVGGDQEELRRLMAFFINACRKCSDIQTLEKCYNFRTAKKMIKSKFKKITLEGVITLVFSFV